MDPHPKPALLLVLDGLRPDVLRAAIHEGDAPNLGALAERGEAVWDAVSVFPSITPAATAAIATGETPGESGIVGHSWYDPSENRIVVYGAMRETVISSGPVKVFHNNVWRMNRDHLQAPTIFERLDERGVDGACVHFPIRRGPYRHPVRLKAVERLANRGAYLDSSVYGPKEYYMGDLFYSRDTEWSGRRGSGGLLRSAGINDSYAADIGAMMISEKIAPFNLVYFFKGDSIAHHKGLGAQRQWVEKADGYMARMVAAAGGIDRLLEDYAVIAISDHGHTPLLPKDRHVDLEEILPEADQISSRARFGPNTRILAVPNGRSAFLYLRAGIMPESVVGRLVSRRGIDLAAWREDGWAVVGRLGRRLRFRPGRPGDGPRDTFGNHWRLDGDPEALEITVSGESLSGGEMSYGEYPNALERLWGCLQSPRSGDVVLSATPGYTFGEVTGSFHTASDHASLHASDSNVFSIASGVPAPRRITDVAPILLEHFGVEAAPEITKDFLERRVG